MKHVKLFSNVLPMKLQLFADGGEGVGEDGASGDGGEGGQDQNQSQITFTDQSELDSWYDKKFAKSAEKLKEGWRQEQSQQKAYEDMTPDEQREHDLEQQQSELADREQKVTIAENRANITQKLAADGLPVGLVAAFEPALSDTDNLEAVYAKVASGYRDTVREAVDKKLAGSSDVPGSTGGGGGGSQSVGESLAEQRNASQQTQKSIWDKKY
ncbi:DUF4355 domain-containing protein [Latilactobacillus curvatus]|uniref:capsid assembly scaffolding protein Gp46 family protein n=1 Tax=Latilactobacillus curvatus TaxID=28038 RepID=UPI00207334AB|nr:DUF4355 domain-containing protein [Latilactobacillus curvatus]MCM6843965.1 DUF4355 domain-containing protein [Latilactobacillus curvatus]MCM6861148.1 DUF4355 domain-containing protein [Latilactobacillus curvatus]MCM6868446.1 DUF4355 domain-containing protein [Latilactobacillus curvatus]